MRALLVAVVVGVSAGGAPSSAPVTVVLRTGERVQGQFEGASKDEVRVRVASQTLKLKTSDVARVLFVDKPAALAGPDANAELLDALRALGSVTELGVSYNDYRPRLADAKVKADRLRAGGRVRDDVWQRASRAMTFYVAAQDLWGAAIQETVAAGFESLPALKACKAWQAAAKERDDIRKLTMKLERAVPDSDLQKLRTVELAKAAPTYLFACARAETAEAAKLLAPISP